MLVCCVWLGLTVLGVGFAALGVVWELWELVLMPWTRFGSSETCIGCAWLGWRALGVGFAALGVVRELWERGGVSVVTLGGYHFKTWSYDRWDTDYEVRIIDAKKKE